MERRQFIVAAGATAAAGLAGCLGGGDGDTSSPEAAASAYVEATQDQDEDRLASIAHPELNTSSGDVNFSDQGNQTSLENAETETVVEGISASDIEGSGGFFSGVTIGEYSFFAEKSTVDSIIENSDMAIVEVRAEEQDETLALLTATDGGDWYVLALGGEAQSGNGTGSSGQ
jgi:hypothetical protein